MREASARTNEKRLVDRGGRARRLRFRDACRASSSGGLLGFGDREGQARAVAGGGVVVDDAFAGGLGDGVHGFGQRFFGGGDVAFAKRGAKALHVRAHRAEVEEVASATLGALAVAFFCGAMVCHGVFSLVAGAGPAGSRNERRFWPTASGLSSGG